MSGGRALGNGSLVRTRRAGGQLVWCASWRDGSRRRHRRYLAEDKPTALRILAKIIRDRDLQIHGIATDYAMERKLSELADRYVEELRVSSSSAHCISVGKHLSLMIARLGDRRVRDIVPIDVMDLRCQRVQAGVSKRVANHEVAHLKSCLEWSLRAGLIPQNPIASVMPLSVTERDLRKRRRALSEDEIRIFLQAADDEDRALARLWAAETTIEHGTKGRAYAERERAIPVPQAPLWRFMLATGVRFGEAAALRWADIDDVRGAATVLSTTTKTRRTRLVPLPTYVLDGLRQLRATRSVIFGRIPGPADLVFVTTRDGSQLEPSRTRKHFLAVLKRAGIPAVDADGRSLDVHALRGTAATRMLRHGINLATVSRILGHSDVQLTMKYYVDLQVEDARRAVEAMPVLGQRS